MNFIYCIIWFFCTQYEEKAPYIFSTVILVHLIIIVYKSPYRTLADNLSAAWCLVAPLSVAVMSVMSIYFSVEWKIEKVILLGTFNTLDF